MTATPLPAAPPTKTPQRVLVVDDEDSVLLLARRVLEAAGYHVVAAEDGRAALDADLSATDLVLSDVAMPGVNGLDLTDHLHDRFPDLPVVLMSSHPPEELADRFGRAPAGAFLRKPFTGTALLDAVRRAARR